MDRLRYFIYVGIVLLIAAAVFFINDANQFDPEKNSSSLVGRGDGTSNARGSQGANGYMNEYQLSSQSKERILSIFDEPDMLDYHTMMEYVRKGKIDMVRELWKLRRKCPANLLPEQCDKKLLLFISERFPYPHNKAMIDLVQKYFHYEKTVRNMKSLRNMKPQERYELLMKKRREIFGESDARLVFGLQETKFHFGKSYQEFIEQSKDMSGEQRMKAYEQMRRNVYGEYYDEIVQREPKFDKYRTEMTLRQNDLDKMDLSQKKNQIRSMRKTYFGKEAADRMDQVDQAFQQRRQNEQTYQIQKQKLLSKNPNLSDKERSAKLRQLAVNVFGSDEQADMFERRQKMREYLRQKQR